VKPRFGGVFLYQQEEEAVTTTKFRREERNRLHRDIALRNRLMCLEDIEELSIRVQDAIETIKFDLDTQREFPVEEYTDDENEDWRARAQLAIARFEMTLRQLERRKELIVRMQSKKQT
jgi:hypothetical protein